MRTAGRVGRIDLGVDRRRGQVGRQQVAGRVDGGLHFLLGNIERQVQVELQRDYRGARGTGRGHLVQARHFAELALQRRGHRRGHHLGARARIQGLHLDGRIIDHRQRRQRQEMQGDQADQHDGRHQQGRADRAQDKEA
jgi:hypothetical protein